jgi:hypothetical protein
MRDGTVHPLSRFMKNNMKQCHSSLPLLVVGCLLWIGGQSGLPSVLEKHHNSYLSWFKTSVARVLVAPTNGHSKFVASVMVVYST